MNACPNVRHLLVLPHLRVQNANAVSSPLTHGFPAITAFMGLMCALERKARSDGLDVHFEAVGVVCHGHQELVNEGYVKTLRLTRNPVDKDGGTAAIVEEGRIHLEISLVLAARSATWLDEPEQANVDASRLAELLATMRVAGGTLLPPASLRLQHRHRPHVVHLTGNEDQQREEFFKLRRHLLPGFALVARDDLLEQRWADLRAENPGVSQLEAWLSLVRAEWLYQAGDASAGEPGDEKNKTKGEWVKPPRAGWIVPIPVGYGALGELHAPGTVANARDAHTPSRFVESLYSVGQWLSPHRLHTPEQLLWYADSQPDAGLYRCRNDYAALHEVADADFDFDFN